VAYTELGANHTHFETGPEGPDLEDQQVEKKSKAAQTRPKKLIRRTCPSGHGSDGSGPKWHAPPCSESAAQKKSFRPQWRGHFHHAHQYR